MTKLTDESSIPAVIAEMTIEEKVHAICSPGPVEYMVERLGIPAYTRADVPLRATFTARGPNPYAYGPRTSVVKLFADPRAPEVLAKHLPARFTSPGMAHLLLKFMPDMPLARVLEGFIGSLAGIDAEQIERAVRRTGRDRDVDSDRTGDPLVVPHARTRYNGGMKSIAHPRSSILWRVALLTTVLLALAARLLPGERTIDDAYITFRYARNLLAGEGFVYNPGQRVQGTTTPLYTLLLAAAKGVLPVAGLPTLALVTNALADAISVVVLAWLGRRVLDAPWLGLATALLWALSPMSATFSIGGMETSVYVLLMLLALASYAAGWSRWSAFGCALATLTRPDALLLVVPLFAHMLWDRATGTQASDPAPQGLCPLRRESLASGGCGVKGKVVRGLPWPEMAIYVLTLAPWVVFATLAFGSPLAHSVVAKSAAYRLEPYSALVRLIQQYATPFFEHETLGTGWVAVGAILYLFLSLLGGLAMVRRAGQHVGGRFLPLVVYPWLYFLAFSLYNPLLFRWYLAPILPMYTLCILYGAHCLLRDLAGVVQERWSAAPLAAHVLESLLVLVAVGMLLNAWTLHPDHGPDRPAPRMAWFKLEQLYRRATLDLLANQPITPETRIAAGDIGVIGYLSGTRILDTVGLVSPEAVGYYPLPETAYVIPYAVSTGLILDEQPDYAILLEVYARNTLQRSEAFSQAYEVYRLWPTDIYGSEGLLVYRKRTIRSKE